MSQTKDNTKNNIELRLGDIIRLYQEDNPTVDKQTFLIDYLDSDKMKLINTESGSKLVVPQPFPFERIVLVERLEHPGFAMQNDLTPGSWITLYFGGEIPSLVVAEITNLEEDMIEIKTYPDNDTLYIDFEYKGIPEDLNLVSIQKRAPPPSLKRSLDPDPTNQRKKVSLDKEHEEEQGDQELKEEEKGEGDQEELEEDQEGLEEEQGDQELKVYPPISDEDIIIGSTEELGPIVEYKDVAPEKRRYPLEEQANDMLADLIASLHKSERTPVRLNQLHTFIERFKQLRQTFSLFDDNGNVKMAKIQGALHKPLVERLLRLDTPLDWILPVVRNIKKIYYNDLDKNQEEKDMVFVNEKDDMDKIKRIFHNFKNAPHELNRYVNLYHELNPFFTPFEQDFNGPSLWQVPVQNNLVAVVNNFAEGSFLSSVVENKLYFKEKQFLTTLYNTGLSRLQTQEGFSGLSHTRTYSRIPLTPNDTMRVESILMLPEPVIRYSRIHLPGTSLLDKANLNRVPLQYWQLLHKNTPIQTVAIESWNQTDIPFDMQQFQHFVLHLKQHNGEEEQEKEKEQEKEEEETKQSRAHRFLQMIVPTTRDLLHHVEKSYMVGKLSMHDIISHLAPFLITSDDITYLQYNDIKTCLDDKISAFNRTFVERSRIFQQMRNTRRTYTFSPSVKAIFNVLPSDMQQLVFGDKYHLEIELKSKGTHDDVLPLTNAEMLTRMTQSDLGNLFQSACSLKNMRLMFSDDLEHLFNVTSMKQEKHDSKDKDCNPFVLAKKYKSMESLLADNHQPIYFDRDYDTTLYSDLDDYENELMSLSSDEFLPFLIKKLKAKKKVDDTEAAYLAETLIHGMKKVKEGQYAVLFLPNVNQEEMQWLDAQYYRRVGDVWTLDTNVDASIFTNDSDMLCELQVQGNPKDETLLSDFDRKYERSRGEMERQLKEAYAYYDSIFDKWQSIRQREYLGFNNQQYRLGIPMSDVVMHEIVVSPFATLLDTILGQGNFIKKQYDIVEFKIHYTRDVYEGVLDATGQEETPHWFYCKTTNVKLLPKFYFDLAYVFINDHDRYKDKLDRIIAEIGTKSDDGGSWVDKYSGREIPCLEFSPDEGYEDGYRIISRDVLEQDLGDLVPSTPPSSSKEGQIITQIVSAIGSNMGIHVDAHTLGFIKQHAVQAFLTHCPKQKDYERDVKHAKKANPNKPKKMLDYQDVYSSYLLYATLGMTLIAIQVSIPSMKTHRVFPGCTLSFSGFPLEGSGDDSSLLYMACVAKGMKAPQPPYNILLHATVDDIANKIRKSIESTLYGFPGVQRKVKEKVEYLRLRPEDEWDRPHCVDAVYNVNRWLQFLPPLVPFGIGTPKMITNEFKADLLDNLNHGWDKQREKLCVMESKIIFFSLALQECIQHIVNEKTLLLKNGNHQPFMQNACCNDSQRGETTLNYFERQNKNIGVFNEQVQTLENMLLDVRSLTEASFLFCRENTKNVYPELSPDFNEETIYRAFIVFCRFNTLVPMPEHLVPVCNNKPDFNIHKMTLKETIMRLKSEGKNYNQESLLRLLQLVNRSHEIHVPTDTYVDNVDGLFQKELQQIFLESNKFPSVLPMEFMNVMAPLVAAEDVSMITESQIKAIKNYVGTVNEQLKQSLTDFMSKHRFGFDLTALLTFKEAPDSGLEANEYQFLKTSIKNMVDLFPCVILNENDARSVSAPHWDLSQRHYQNIDKFLKDYYRDFHPFFNNPTLGLIFKRIQQRCGHVVTLAQETPYFTQSGYSSSSSASASASSTHQMFDKGMTRQLLHYYFLLILHEYTVLAEDENDEQGTHDRLSLDTEKNLTMEGNRQLRKKNVAHVLHVFLQRMQQDKKVVDKTYESIMDKVYKNKQREKKMITDNFRSMQDDLREVKNLMKINKLGEWSKGLQKGLKQYVKVNYDDDRAFIENLHQAEHSIRRHHGDANDDNIDLLVDDLIEERRNAQEIEADVNEILVGEEGEDLNESEELLNDGLDC